MPVHCQTIKNFIMLKNVGIEWVKDYGVKFRFLPNSDLNTQGFLHIINTAATGNFEYGDTAALGLARGKHFEPTPHPPFTLQNAPADHVQAAFGEDDSAAETVDLIYFCGHGVVDRLLFSGTNLDDSEAWNMEMRLGDKTILKWFVADTCDVLSAGYYNAQNIFVLGGNGEDVRLRWRRIFRGLRYLLGFHGESTSVPNRGSSFARDLNLGDTVRHAWEMACEHSEPGFASWAYLKAGDPGDAIENDRWTDIAFTTVPITNPMPCTYVRNIPPVVT